MKQKIKKWVFPFFSILLFIFSTNFYSFSYAEEIIKGWYKVCSKQNKIDICSTMNSVISETGQYLTMVNLIEVVGKENQRRLGIQVPTGRIIPEGIKLKIDNGKEKVIPYMVCNGSSCIANDYLDDTLINSMKNGKFLTITSVNFQGSYNPVEISLKGFSHVFTGPGMKEKDFQEEQEKLQKAISMQQKEIENRMRKEQEKIRTTD